MQDKNSLYCILLEKYMYKQQIRTIQVKMIKKKKKLKLNFQFLIHQIDR